MNCLLGLLNCCSLTPKYPSLCQDGLYRHQNTTEERCSPLTFGAMTPFDRAEYDALPEVLTTAQVARLLDMTEVQVRHWAIQGDIPATRIGRSFRFSKSLLVQWVAGDSTA